MRVSPEVDEFIKYLADINNKTKTEVIKEILTDYVKSQMLRQKAQMRKISKDWPIAKEEIN